jgi:mannose/cellobiose epimerase-like protein (N-acyl-D-glucosamine 2-epimerase family)
MPKKECKQLFERELVHLRAWIRDDALPVWAEQGRDDSGYGFREHLTLAGRPADVAFKRMRVQARQLYVFSHAYLLGLHPDLTPAADAFGFITRHGLRDDGAWVRLLGRRGGVLDATADLYDLAFVMFSLAWYGRASGEQLSFVLARRTAEFVCQVMAAPGGGFHNSSPAEPGYRQQNPHMHLLEAALALYAMTDEALYANLAREIITLFQDRLFHRDSGTLGEFFDSELRAASGEAGDHIEPGHQYEWVWLLDQYATLFHCDLPIEAARLYQFAETHGRNGSGPGIVDVVGRKGVVRRASCRVWPQTEALKAHCAMARRGFHVDARIADGISHLCDRYFTQTPRGTWREHFSSSGELLVDKIPASSLYHIFLAFAELDSLKHGGALAWLRLTSNQQKPRLFGTPEDQSASH